MLPVRSLVLKTRINCDKLSIGAKQSMEKERGHGIGRREKVQERDGGIEEKGVKE